MEIPIKLITERERERGGLQIHYQEEREKKNSFRIVKTNKHAWTYD